MRRLATEGVSSTLLSVVLLLLLVTQVFASIHHEPPVPQPPGLYTSLQNRPQYVVLLILDGGLPSYFKLSNFPHISALMQQGVTYTHAWDGMLETETPTGHATLGTGSLPRRHGVISFGWVPDGSDAVEQPTNPIPIQQGQLEQLLRRSGVPSIASLLKQHDRSATVVVTSGHKDYAVDAVGGWAADYLMYYSVRNQMWTPLAIPRHVPPQSVMNAPGLTMYAPHLASGDQDSLAIQLAMSAFRQLHQRVTIVNLPEFDWPLGHLQGGAADKWLAWKLMTRLDSDIASIEWQLQQEHLLKKTLFVLTADHGMLTLNHSVSYESIQSAVQAGGTKLVDYHVHTAGYLWLQDRSRAAQVAAKILALRNPYIRAVYYRQPRSYSYIRASDIHALASPEVDRAYQFLLSTLAGPNAPQVVIFLAENTSIHGRNQTGWKGDHGGASWNAEHIPLILSGPGIRHGVKSRYPATLYDVAPTILALLGVQPVGMDGVVLADALTDVADSAVTVQQARGAQLQPFVQALMAQSRRDGP